LQVPGRHGWRDLEGVFWQLGSQCRFAADSGLRRDSAQRHDDADDSAGRLYSASQGRGGAESAARDGCR
ncbi:MAG: hypothetical protein ACK56F_24820, partial [bacterium]